MIGRSQAYGDSLSRDVIGRSQTDGDSVSGTRSGTHEACAALDPTAGITARLLLLK